MATASRHLCRALLRASRATPAKRKCIAQCQRPFSVAAACRDSKPEPKLPQPVYLRDIDEDLREIEQERGFRQAPEYELETLRKLYEPEPSEYMSPETPLTLDDLTREEHEDYKALSKEQKSDYLPRLNHFKALAESTDRQVDEDTADKMISRLRREDPIDLRIPPATSTKTGMGIWAEDEEDEFGQTPDNDDEQDPSAMTSVAENELQLHREIRQYTRVAAWEMPLLTSKYSIPPTKKPPLT